jgi:hypothetical protein
LARRRAAAPPTSSPRAAFAAGRSIGCCSTPSSRAASRGCLLVVDEAGMAATAGSHATTIRCERSSACSPTGGRQPNATSGAPCGSGLRRLLARASGDAPLPRRARDRARGARPRARPAGLAGACRPRARLIGSQIAALEQSRAVPDPTARLGRAAADELARTRARQLRLERRPPGLELER